MFYYLPNKRPIDVEGAIGAMLDDNLSNRYFLDTETGEVGCVETDGGEKLAGILREKRRYRELPRVSEETQAWWFEKMVRDYLTIEDATLAKSILEEFRTRGFKSALAVLASRDEYWDGGWCSWTGDCTFEDLGSWLRKAIPGFSYELKGCEDCAICRAAKSGAGIEELRDAFDEQKSIDDDGAPEKREVR